MLHWLSYEEQICSNSSNFPLIVGHSALNHFNNINRSLYCFFMQNAQRLHHFYTTIVNNTRVKLNFKQI